MDYWTILGILAVVLLIYYWNSRNAVWGGFTFGIIIGLVLFIFKGNFVIVVGKSAVVGTLLGFLAELLGMLSDYLKRKR